MYERRNQKLLSRQQFARRAGTHAAVGGLIGLSTLGIGMLGYHRLAGLEWTDAFLNASMILGGMGPVDRLDTSPAKTFAGVYALFAGLVFVAVMGITIAPWAHRLMHQFHIEAE